MTRTLYIWLIRGIVPFRVHALYRYAVIAEGLVPLHSLTRTDTPDQILQYIVALRAIDGTTSVSVLLLLGNIPLS